MPEIFGVNVPEEDTKCSLCGGLTINLLDDESGKHGIIFYRLFLLEKWESVSVDVKCFVKLQGLGVVPHQIIVEEIYKDGQD